MRQLIRSASERRSLLFTRPSDSKRWTTICCCKLCINGDRESEGSHDEGCGSNLGTCRWPSLVGITRRSPAEAGPRACRDEEALPGGRRRGPEVTNLGLPDIYQVSGQETRRAESAKGVQLNVRPEERFRVLYEGHVEDVARYVARRTAGSDVQDVVADTFLTAWRRFDDLPHDPLPWLIVTARKLIANRHRSTERQGALLEKLSAGPAWVFEQAAPSDLSEVDARLLAAISELPAAEREAFMLVAWEGLDAPRAARAAGCSAATFRMRLHRARRRLKQQIGPPRPFVQVPEIQTSLEESR